MPDDVLFERIAEQLVEGEASVKSLLGGELYDAREGDRTLLHLCNRMACLTAYKLAIPHLDLVLTDNGFGVVSNQNVAPASAERVNRLIQQVQQSLDDTIDELLDSVKDEDPESVFVVGGGTVYTALLPYCKRVYMTRVDATAGEPDTYFPNLDKLPGWEIEEESEPMTENGVTYRFIDYVNNNM